MKKQITFRMVAYTDAAGKYTENALRNGNEDNFYVDDDLGDDTPNHCQPDEVTSLSEYGMLMAVADGMGGMNAGEVASQIAMDTVKEYFAPGNITVEMAAHHENRKKYLEDVILEADKRIKNDAKQNPEHEGMGSTIILAWMVDDELSVSWCGDSRAYRFNPINGIELLSEDHSYVQDLVKQGILTYEQTFEHPQGNIVTRSLGDPSKKAQPETKLFNIYQSDIILLCSDGLSGVLRDKKTFDENGNLLPGENLEDLIRENRSSMKTCREALWGAAERADWYDNVTAILCEIIRGESEMQKTVISPVNQEKKNENSSRSFWQRTISMKALAYILGCFIALTFVGILFLKYSLHSQLPNNNSNFCKGVCGSVGSQASDSIMQDSVDSKGSGANTSAIIGNSTEKPFPSANTNVEKEEKKNDSLNIAEPGPDYEATNIGEENNFFMYKVEKSNETVYWFATKYAGGAKDTTRIMKDSGLRNSTSLQIGDTIKIHKDIHKEQ